MSGLTVNLEYKNRNMDTTSTKTYTFEEYTELLKFESMKLIMYVEEVFSEMQDHKEKKDWDDNVLNGFVKIRHKLLDQANAIGRLPSNLTLNGVPYNLVKSSDFIADIINHSNIKE